MLKDSMARTPYPRSDRDLLARISRSAAGKAGYKQLIRELGLGGGRERRLLLEQLTRMVARGELARASEDMWAVAQKPAKTPLKTAQASSVQARRHGKPGHWGVFEAASRNSRDRLVSGKLDLHRDGFGFVRPEANTSIKEDIFIPPNEINGAMQGDVVLVDEAPPGRDGRRSGRIARVLTRRNPTIVGIFHYVGKWSGFSDFGSINGNYVKPLDERIGGPILIAKGDEVIASRADSPHRMLGEEGRHQLEWQPKDHRYPLEGIAVDVEIIGFASPGRPATGRVIQVLGPPDAFGVDVEIVIRKHHIPHAFPAPVLLEAAEQSQQTVASLDSQELENREDFRGLPIVTIDGETARDFDDAVLVRALPHGNNELQVHIADVSHYVLPGSALDTEARFRGTSVYFPDRAVPMLPHALSSGMCSLLPNEDRLVLSCIMEIDPQGEIVGFRVAEGIIRSARRMTYTSVQHCLNAHGELVLNALDPAFMHTLSTLESKPATAEDLAERERVEMENPGLPEAVDRMLELALRLNAKRVRRGSIDFDLPEPVIEFDPDGNMKAIVKSERGWSHRLIEEFMLSANECVAHWLEWQGIASIYRIHEMPDPKRIVEFEETAAGFGQTLGIASLPVKKFTMKSDRRDARVRSARGRDSRAAPQHEVPESIPVTPQMYQRLIGRISGHAEERILAYLMLRSLKQARYAEQNEGHFALASPSYTHFTSPIRRYPDLIVHRLVRAMLRSGADARGGAVRSDDAQPWGKGSVVARGDRGATNAGISPLWRTKRASGRDDGGGHGPMAPEELNDVAAESSLAERRAADAERELIEWKKMRFMEDRVGDDFKAQVLSVTKYGFFVELDEMFIEGLVPLASLAGDHYTFRDTDRTIVGSRTGHVFGIGQRVQVILDRIDRQQRRLQFALLPGTEPVGQRRVPTHDGETVVNRPPVGLRRGKSEAKKAKAKEKKAGGKAKQRKRKKVR
jgi:ribonuclease R